MKVGSIYIIKNKVNSKVYIGQTVMTVHDRFIAHTKPSTHKKRSSYKIYNAMNKYGVENFYYEILEEKVPVELLNEKEIEYIKEYDSYKNGYNSTTGGDGRVINKLNDEEIFVEMIKKGHLRKEIADALNISTGTVTRTAHKLGYYFKESISKEDIEKCLDEGLSNIEIATKYNVHKTTVSRLRDKYGLRGYRKKINHREDFDIEGFKYDFINGMNKEDVCKKYNLSSTSLQRLLQEYKLNTLGKQKFINRAKEMYELREKGLTFKEIGDMYDLEYRNVFSQIKKYRKSVETNCKTEDKLLFEVPSNSMS